MHHRAKAPDQAVIDANFWHDNSRMNSGHISNLINDIYDTPELERDWDVEHVPLVNSRTVYGWINFETRGDF